MIVTDRIENVDQLGFFIYRLCRDKETYKLQRKEALRGMDCGAWENKSGEGPYWEGHLSVFQGGMCPNEAWIQAKLGVSTNPVSFLWVHYPPGAAFCGDW